MAKDTTRIDIKDASKALQAIMQEGLVSISSAMIDQVMKNWRNATPSQRFTAIKGITPSGANEYKKKLLNAYAVIAADAIKKARKAVPKAKSVRLSEIDENALQLGEFDSLPSDVQKRLKAMLDLLVDTQVSDLEKQVFFQYTSSVDTTDTEAVLFNDLEVQAGEYIEGASIRAGSEVNAATIINEARLAFFQDDDVTKEIEAYEFVNGDPVSPICQDLAGTVFSKDDPNLNRYWPPLHFNCKSYIAPILNGNLGNREITPLKASTKKIDDSVQFSERFAQKLQEYSGVI